MKTILGVNNDKVEKSGNYIWAYYIRRLRAQTHETSTTFVSIKFLSFLFDSTTKGLPLRYVFDVSYDYTLTVSAIAQLSQS